MVELLRIVVDGDDQFGLIALAPLVRATVLQPEDMRGRVTVLYGALEQAALDATVDRFFSCFYGGA